MSKEQVVVTNKKKKKIKIFPIVNAIIFILIALIIMVPIWKVIVDSFDKTAGYGMNFWPQQFTFGGYGEVISKSALCTYSVGNARQKSFCLHASVHNDFRWWYDS